MRAAGIRAAVAAVALAGASLVGMAIAQPAQAAVSCTGTSSVTRGNAVFIMPTAGGSIDCQLAIGNNSGAVSTLQSSLKMCNGQNIAVDGDYGPATQQAVRNVQAKTGATVDGIYGPQTRDRMGWRSHQVGSARIVCAKFPG